MILSKEWWCLCEMGRKTETVEEICSFLSHGTNMFTSQGANEVESMGLEVCRGWENQTVRSGAGSNALVKYICSVTLGFKPLYT